MNDPVEIDVVLGNGEEIKVLIYAEECGPPEVIDPSKAIAWGESRYQLKEGASYLYEVVPGDEGYQLEKSPVIRPFQKKGSSSGRIVTNVYVGSLEVPVLQNGVAVGKLLLEVCSVKTGYRDDYRKMLQDITAKCTDLLLSHSSHVYQSFTVDKDRDYETDYQRFLFVDSMVRSDLFLDSLHRISSMPVKRWETVESHTAVYNIRRANSSVMRQMVTGKNRTRLPEGHSLRDCMDSLPDKIRVTGKQETADIPENRFIKYVLETFMQFCLEVSQKAGKDSRLRREAAATAELLSRQLHLPVFKEVSRLDMIPLHSPVLQRKEGYREVLQTYLMFDMAARLIWRGGEDVYKGGKRDVAVLYEYWLFFKLLDWLEEVFSIKPKSVEEIIKPTKDRLELTLKRGIHTMIDGVYDAGCRLLHVQFSYNRSFSKKGEYPVGGSWTTTFQPDYTLSIWPEGFSQEEAEVRELIVHIHFDAKYRIEDYRKYLEKVSFKKETEEEDVPGDAVGPEAVYRREDLLKMHAYKDAIRRTAGAYILYPGTQPDTFQSFHEILPGLGAFVVSPGNASQTDLKEFLLDVVDHFLNRASQREHLSYHTYHTFYDKPGPGVREPLPTDDGTELPQSTRVLVGYYKSEAHLKWIVKNKLYNMRADTVRGSVRLSPEMMQASYLVLHGKGELKTNLIFRIYPVGPLVLSREFLEKKQYPSDTIKPLYIGYTLESSQPIPHEFGNAVWDLAPLLNDKGFRGRKSAMPFTVTLQELMQVRCTSFP